MQPNKMCNKNTITLQLTIYRDMYTCCASLFSPINDASDVYMCEYEKKNQ